MFQQLIEAVVSGKAKDVEAQVQRFINQKVEAHRILDDALLPAMEIVGDKFKKNEFFVPQVLFAARAMKAGMELLKPLILADGPTHQRATVVLGTAQGDQHDIGKNLVAMMLESGGYRIVDLGTNVSPQQFIDAATRENAAIIGISALMTTTMPSMVHTVEAIKEAGLQESLKVIIGGAPVTQQFADEIGAAAYGASATDAVGIAKSIVQ